MAAIVKQERTDRFYVNVNTYITDSNVVVEREDVFCV